MRDYVSIGSSPLAEDCAQLGKPNYDPQSMLECRALIAQLRRELGNEPPNARLDIKVFPHDFGSYREVVCYYDDADEASMNYAFKCESDCPEFWDNLSIEYLKEKQSA